MTFSYLNPKCEARDLAEGGCGVFACDKIMKDDLISLWGGKIVRRDELVPQRLWDHAEHGAAVQALPPGLNLCELKAAEALHA